MVSATNPGKLVRNVRLGDWRKINGGLTFGEFLILRFWHLAVKIFNYRGHRGTYGKDQKIRTRHMILS